MFYGDNSMLSLDGEAHAAMRRALMVPVLRNPAIAARLMREAAVREVSGQKAARRSICWTRPGASPWT